MAFGRKKTQLTFEEGIARWEKRPDQAPMPPARWAMWKGDAKFGDDISDRTLFNEQFIESNYTTPALVDTVYITSTIHTIVVTFCVAAVIIDPSFWLTALIFYSCYSLPFFYFPLWLLSHPVSGIRFNRQAQVVQSMSGKRIRTVPWRDVKAYMRDRGLGLVEFELAFPPPPGYPNRHGIYWVDGQFDALDGVGIDGPVMRWEFIRRYMEEGLDAIQPTAELSHYDKPAGPKRLASFYWPGFGPLIDRFVAKCQSQFRWPDEVFKLGEPGADVSAYDTRPLASSKHVFYRYDPREGVFYFCNSEGQRLPPIKDTDATEIASDE